MDELTTLAPVLHQARRVLAAAGCDTPDLDAEVLLSHVLQRPRAWLYAHPSYLLDAEQVTAFQTLVRRRAAREPVAYLTGHKEFFGLDLLVTPDVLIPRPETEGLVELILEWAAGRMHDLLAADVGTGSGAIAVGLAVHLPHIRVVAGDILAPALAVARRNVIKHRVEPRVLCVQADLLPPCSVPFDLIVSNPPYLCQAELAAAAPEVVNWEPRRALDGGVDGLAVIRSLLAAAAARLHPHGMLAVEIGATQGQPVLELARRWFPRARIEIRQDYAGRDRILVVDQIRARIIRIGHG